MSGADYNDAFVAALRRSMDSGGEDSLKRRSSELVKNREVARLFPGHSALWLQKELSKWRGKLDGDAPRFNGTLQSLQIYCTLMGLTPNDVLLPKSSYAGASRIEFLRFETIMDLAGEIRRQGRAMRHGCVLPVLYAPGRMTTVFLFLYPQKRAGVDTVFLRFGISEPDGYVDGDGADCSGGVATALDSSLHAVDLLHEEWDTRLSLAYRKICGEFDAVCGAAESQLDDAVNDFYDYMGDWADRHADEEDLLFSWYPPCRGRQSGLRSLDSLSAAVSGGAYTAGRER